MCIIKEYGYVKRKARNNGLSEHYRLVEPLCALPPSGHGILDHTLYGDIQREKLISVAGYMYRLYGTLYRGMTGRMLRSGMGVVSPLPSVLLLTFLLIGSINQDYSFWTKFTVYTDIHVTFGPPNNESENVTC